MNKHFEDTRYYLGRATDSARAGLGETVDPLEERGRAFRDRGDDDTEPGRFDAVRGRLRALESDVRARIENYRRRQSAE